MNAVIVTFVRAYNHGAVLQCYALQKKIQDLGVNVEVLDYYPKYFRDVYTLPQVTTNNFPSRYPFLPGLRLKRFRHILNTRLRAFEQFIKKNINLSKEQYYSTEEVQKADLNYDCYIDGSDQVWSFRWNEFDPVFFLDFPSARMGTKASYAASFGFSVVPPQLEKEYIQRLKDWDYYSVREKSGIGLIETLVGKKAVQCCDPTLLLTRDEWSAVTKDSTTAIPKTKYILAYYVNDFSEIADLAAKLKEKTGLDVITVTSLANLNDINGSNSIKRGFIPQVGAGPADFINLIANSEYVISESFHGTVFSVIFHKKFLSVTQRKTGEKNGRVLELLQSVGIEKDVSDVELIDYGFDWDYIDKNLAQYTQTSVDYLKKIFGMDIKPYD